MQLKGGKRKVEESCSPPTLGTAATTKKAEGESGFKVITKLLISQLRGRHMVK